MSTSLFPTITPDLAGSYIRTARLTENAVARRIHEILSPTSPHMIRRCMYCGADFGRKPCVPAMHGNVSHGICNAEACVSRAEREFGGTLQRGVRESSAVVGETTGGADHAASPFAYGCGVRPEGQRTPDEGALGLQPEQPSLPIHGATPAAA